MSIRTPEIPSVYGALDSLSGFDGAPASAQMLRQIGRNSNRVICQGEPLLNLVWDSSTDDPDGSVFGALQGRAPWGLWLPVYWSLFPVEKKPGLRTAELQVFAKVTQNEMVHLQVATQATPFNAQPDFARAKNILTMPGTGSLALYTMTGIPVHEGDSEILGLYVSGGPSSTLVSTVTYGTPSSGVADVLGANTLTLNSALWDVPSAGSTVGTLADGSVVVVFLDNNSVPLAMPRKVINVTSPETLVFYPDLFPDEVHILQGSTFKLYHAPYWRLASVDLYTEDRLG